MGVQYSVGFDKKFINLLHDLTHIRLILHPLN